MDFNPYCPATDPLLFSWDELTPNNRHTFPLSLSHLPLPPSPLSAPPCTHSHNSDNSELPGASCNGAIDGESTHARAQQQLLPVFRIVDGESIQPSDLQSFRLPKVTEPTV